ncbi:MAG: aldo/keto reductase [Planctomycetota bacterium]
MRYTELGSTGLTVSRLGFGCMRLPMQDDETVDREKAIPVLHRAYKLGVNFYDTAVFYCKGDSQRVVGEAFEDRREDVILSTKNHHYDKDDPDGWRRHLENSLERLRTDYIDIYNHHGLNYDKFKAQVAGNGGLYQQMLKARDEGLIRHICFSFHGSSEQLVKLVDTGLYETVILQYNLLDRHLEDGIAHAAENGMGVIVMGPVGGGRLGYPSDRAASLVGEVKSTPELALRFVLSNPGVSVALSGMSDLDMVEENAAVAAEAGGLSEKHFERIEEAIEERKKLSGLYCTGCNYCMPCPVGVDIPKNFEILNLDRVFGLDDHARKQYAALEGKAALCQLCGQCVESCPQDIDIPAKLNETVATLDDRAGEVVAWMGLRGGRLMEGQLDLDFQCNLKNLGDTPRTGVLELIPHGEDEVSERHIEWELSAYGRRSKRFSLTIPQYAEAYNLDMMLSYEDDSHHLSFGDMVIAVPRTSEYVLDADRERAGDVHVPAPFHPAVASGEHEDNRHFDFSLAADEDNLYVFVRVQDDLTAEGKGGEAAHNLRIYVDGRASHLLGRKSYGTAVGHVTITPREREKAEVEWSHDGEIECEMGRWAHGYCVDCALPWSDVSASGSRPDVVGFNVRMLSSGPNDEEPMELSWTGRGKSDRDASSFGKIVLLGG